jgi:tripartite-type tricarboxylate transporter receptor subunit TctC
MTFLLRPTMQAVGGLLWLSSVALSTAAHAQTSSWPERPIRIVTPFPAGSAPDTALRKITPELSKALGQAVIVENRPGAGGRIAAAEVAHAAPDGYTFANADSSAIIMLPATGAKMSYDAQKDLLPVVRLLNTYPFIAVPANSAARKLLDLKNLGHAPTFGVAGLGGYSHAVCASLGKIVGVECNPVPYSQGNTAAMFDVAKGNIDLAMTFSSEAKGFLDMGKIRLLATFAPSRSANYPDVPSITEFAPPESAIAIWMGFFAPTGTPTHIVDRMRTETNKVIAGDAFKQWYESLGNQVEILDGLGFNQFLASQRTSLKKIVDAYGLKSE